MKKVDYQKSIIVLIVFFVAIVAVDSYRLRTSLVTVNSSDTISYDMAEVLKVIDGDTIEVLISGHKEQIRFIGVNCPELNDHYSEEAKRFTSNELLGKIVYMEKDTIDKDHYNRLLRYVWTRIPSSEDDNITEMFNVKLLSEGYASILKIAPNDKYAAQFQTIEKESQEKNKGIWELK
ncbi:MAG: nuclease [Firmicutes bacterium HGW-Firmicutes-1]|jgi:micrococcal nuclease|nr:MAG: nuclease [Firmicutes bacterium HGW-Firmicutes-1]